MEAANYERERGLVPLEASRGANSGPVKPWPLGLRPRGGQGTLPCEAPAWCEWKQQSQNPNDEQSASLKWDLEVERLWALIHPLYPKWRFSNAIHPFLMKP